MKKTITIISIFAMLISSQVMARCNPELISFGSSVKEVAKKFDDKFLFPSDIPEDIPMTPVFVPGEMVCKDEKFFKGTSVEYIFLYGELTEIRLMRLSDSPSLVKWAEKIYGEKKNKPLSFFKDEPYATWLWDSFNSVIGYELLPDYNGQVTESIIIQSRRHKSSYEKYGQNEDDAFGEKPNE